MNSNLQVRSVEVGDFDRWRELWRGYQEFYKVSFTDAQVLRTWTQLHDAAQPVHGAVAQVDERVVGLVHYLYHPSTWTDGDYCYLQDLFVDPVMRCHGIAEKLIRHVYEQAQNHQAVRVYWLTLESNAPAMRLYDRIAERSGFVQYRHRLIRSRST